ncbi:MAG: O-antigen ligase family protein [Bacteroidetes bacterium]|nr:O-antigen ligase family protein [Bacteroidota bacterium]
MATLSTWTPLQRWLFWLGLLLMSTGFVWGYLHGYALLMALPLIVVVALGLVFRTETTILLFGALAPLSINFQDLGAGLGLALPTEPVYILAFMAIVVWFMLKGQFDKRLLKHPIVLAVLAYAGWLWLASAFSSMPMVSFKFSLARTWYIVVYFFFVLRLFRQYQTIHQFLKLFAFFTLTLVVITLVKHAADGFARSSSYGISWPFFPDHGMYAAAIAFAVPILAFYTFNARAMGFSMPWVPLLAFALLILLFGILVSYTRATWLSLIAAMGVFALLKMKVRFGYIVLLLLVGGTVALSQQDQILYSLEANKQGSSDELEGHVKSVSNITTDPSNLERINRWKCAGRMVSEKPLFGFGPGTYVFQYAPFQKSSELTIISTHAGDLGDAHSEFFSAMSESGYPGLFFFVALVLSTLWVGFRLVARTSSRPVRITATLALFGLSTYYFHALLNNYSQYDKIGVPFWVFTAIIVALDLYHRHEEPTEGHATESA